MLKRIYGWLLLAALSLPGCTSLKKPAPFKPRYVYMVLYGGKFQGYPAPDSGLTEVTVEASQIVGGMCLPPDDFEKQQVYILDLEAIAERK